MGINSNIQAEKSQLLIWIIIVEFNTHSAIFLFLDIDIQYIY